MKYVAGSLLILPQSWLPRNLFFFLILFLFLLLYFYSLGNTKDRELQRIAKCSNIR